MVEKDLYKILGVPRGAKADDIKRAYKKKSLKHHPDKNRGDPDANAKFQKIAEAIRFCYINTYTYMCAI